MVAEVECWVIHRAVTRLIWQCEYKVLRTASDSYSALERAKCEGRIRSFISAALYRGGQWYLLIVYEKQLEAIASGSEWWVQGQSFYLKINSTYLSNLRYPSMLEILSLRLRLVPFVVWFTRRQVALRIGLSRHGKPSGNYEAFLPYHLTLFLRHNLFRYGLDYLRSLVTDLDLKYDEFLLSLQFLSCT